MSLCELASVGWHICQNKFPWWWYVNVVFTPVCCPLVANKPFGESINAALVCCFPHTRSCFTKTKCNPECLVKIWKGMLIIFSYILCSSWYKYKQSLTCSGGTVHRFGTCNPASMQLSFKVHILVIQQTFCLWKLCGQHVKKHFQKSFHSLTNSIEESQNWKFNHQVANVPEHHFLSVTNGCFPLNVQK